MSLQSSLIEGLYHSLDKCQPSSLLTKLIYRKKNSLYIKDQTYALKKNGIYIIGFGKASAGMACELEKIIGHSRIASGLVITPPTKIRTKKINLFESSHPKLTEKSFIAGQKLIDYSRSIPANSLVICLNSGGGSALIASPTPNLSIKEKTDFFEFLLTKGINEIDQNVIRKSISNIKGGKLGKIITNNNSMIVNLVLMDNPYDYKALSSGPTFSHQYSQSAKSILLREKLFSSIDNKIKKIIELESNESLHYNDELIHDYIVGGPYTAKANFVNYAKKQYDYVWEIDKVYYNMDINIVLKDFVSYCNDKILSNNQKGTHAIIANGEIPIKLPKSHGNGGRNQHFAALVLKEALNLGWKNFVFASFATDGQDFKKNIHGAIISDESLKIVNENNLTIEEYIKVFDTFNLHTKLDSLLRGGLSGTNCSDLYIFVFSK